MLKRIISLCVVVLAFTQTLLAHSQQSRKAEPEVPAVSLCQLVSHAEQYERKVVRLQTTLQAASLESFVIGLMLIRLGCEPVDAYFEKAEDEAALLKRLREAVTVQAQVTVVGRLRGARWPGCEFNYGPMGVFKYQSVIESISAVTRLAKEPIQ
jgi:hypothetical protein